MTGIYVKLLGQPKIFKEGNEVFFSYTKINALLYYLFCHKQANREELASLLWPNKTSAASRKNLRNCIYQANKILKLDIIVSLNRSILALNPTLTIESDLDSFTSQPLEHLELYQGTFLQDFYLKDSEEFEFWVSKMRASLDKQYSQACYDQLASYHNQEQCDEKESLLLKLIEMDEFEEKNYQLLMQLYQEQHRTGKIIETYYKLVDLFDRELGVAPSPDTRRLYEKILEHDNPNHQSLSEIDSELLFERVSEVKQIEQFLQTIDKSNKTNLLVLQGNTGSGKRTLIRKVLTDKKNKYDLLKLQCRRDEWHSNNHAIFKLINHLHLMVFQENLMPIQDWQKIYNRYFPNIEPLDLKISNIKDQQLLINFIVSILKLSCQQKPFILLIEESHWLDEKSIVVLQESLSNLKTTSFALILTKHKHEAYALDNFIQQELVLKRGKLLEIAPLSQDDTRNYLLNLFTKGKLSQDLIEKIFTVSQGNPFLLSEYINLLKKGQEWSPLTPAIRAKISLKLGQLNSLEEEILDYLSCCPQGLSLSVLTGLLASSEHELVCILDKLCDLHILEQIDEDKDIIIDFKQKVIPFFIYDNLSLTKRKVLHLRIAEYLEGLLKQTPSSAIMEELVHHFLKAKEPLKALTYDIDILNTALQFRHELFPISYDKGYHLRSQETYPIKVDSKLEQLWQTLTRLEDSYALLPDFQVLKLRLRYLEGRYLIRIGDYDKGISHIQQVIAKAKALNQIDYLIESYKQIIYYCIQEDQVAELQHYTELALEAAADANNHEAIGVALRLRGLYYLITGQEDLAQKHLLRSIDCYSVTNSLKKKYAIQIAAALDYLGEMEQVNGRFKEAISYQSQSIQLSEGNDTSSYHLFFHIRRAISHYWQGQMDKAAVILQDLTQDDLKRKLPWLETQVTTYKILLHLANHDSDKLEQLLDETSILNKPLSSKRDLGLQYYLIALLKNLSGEQFSLKYQLNADWQYYQQLALTHLNPYRDALLINHLQELL